MIIIDIPELPISTNQAWRTFRGRMITTREYKEWNSLVEQYIPDCPDLSSSPLAVEVTLYSPEWFTKKGTIRKVDLDNYAKVLLDSIFKHLIVDDSQIFQLKMFKEQGSSPRTLVKIYDLSVN